MLLDAEAGAGAGHGLRPCGENGGGPPVPIGLLTLELFIPDSHSLKDKRQVLRSLKDRLRGRYNIAVAELDHQDNSQRALVGIVSISSDGAHLEQSLRTVLHEAEEILGRDLAGHEIEFL
jgi:uncharacterized protein YlxP (DUF503 family)